MSTLPQEAAPTQDDRLARAAYEGYCAASGGRSVISGAELPSWEQQAEPVQKAWRSAAQAVVNVYSADSGDQEDQ